MKRILGVLLALFILLVFTACGGDVENSTTVPTTLLTSTPLTEPPATELPTTEPPATEPPATEPPATEPSATNPPATNPPATNPPATNPPATSGSTYVCSCGFTCACENVNGIIGYCPHFAEHYKNSPSCCSHPASFYSSDLYDMENHFDYCGLCDTKIAAYPHNWEFSAERSTKSDCDPNAYSFECYVCTDCGLGHLEYLGEGHIYGERTLLTAGCTNSGPRYERICQRCGCIEQTVDENGERGPCYSYTANPCDHDSYCESCGEKISDKLGHTGGIATCTNRPICTRCGRSYGNTLGGHRGGTATCTSGAICDTCGSEYTEALGHRNTYVTGQVEPTCCDGYTGDTHCSDCGTVISGSTIPPAYEHTWVEISRTQTATEWTVVSQCSNCGSTSTVSIKIG